MDKTATVAYVKTLAATDKRPTLTETEVQAIVGRYPIRDSNGVPANADGWDETFDAMAAAAEAWRIKAGRVAGDFNFAADGTSMSKADVMAHCLEMEARYAAKAGSPSGLGSGGTNGTMTVGSSVMGYQPKTYIDQATYTDAVLP